MSKKKVKRIGIIAILLFFLATFPVYADSGFDGDYGSGGSSSFDSSSSSSSSYDSGGGSSFDSHSSSSSSHYSTSGDLPWGAILFYLSFLLALAIAITMQANKAREKSKIRSRLSEPTNFIINQSISKRNLENYKRKNIENQKRENIESEIKKILPNFKEEQLKQDVFTIYKKIQVAWMDFDYDTLRKYCTDELYNMYYQQLEVLKQKKQKNVMKNFSQKDFYIVDFSYNEKEMAIKVRTIIQCYDYVVSEDNKVVRGSDRMMRLYDYEMTFTQGIKKGANTKCPNCGASIENSNSSVCSYCNSKITNSDNYDLVLAKKEVISQHSV